MHKIINIFIFLLTLTVFGVLSFALYVTFVQINAASNNEELLGGLSLLPAITISAGVLVAIITFARDKKKQIIDQERHVSEVMLERVIDGFNTVIDLLSDQNNNRVIWVRAARTLLKAIELKAKITTDEYKVAYNLEEERARNELYTILSINDKKTGDRNPFPPQFFYGIKDWESCTSLDEAAIKASGGAVTYALSIDEVPPQPYLMPLSVKSVIVIFDFMEFPKTEKEPLREIEIWDDNWADSHGIDRGARRYVEHTKRKYAISGKLHERDTKEHS